MSEIRSVEVGDIVFFKGGGSGSIDPTLGTVLRPLTTEELSARSLAEAWWVQFASGSGGSHTYVTADQVLMLAKSNKVAADDLGAAINLPNPVT
jgi:hypothetical protein